MIAKILMNILGIMIYFLNRFNNRRVKSKFSPKYWLHDNWPEMTVTVLVDLALMVLFLTGDLKLNVLNFLPEWIGSAGDITVSFVMGVGFSAFIYKVFKKKMSVQLKNYSNEENLEPDKGKMGRLKG